jgi:hypothetical protein
MPGRRISSHTKQQMFDLLAEGHTPAEVSRITGISEPSINRFRKGLVSGHQTEAGLKAMAKNPPRSWDELDELGQDCLRSFPAFSREFFVRDVPPWRAAAATTIVEALLDLEQRYLVLSVAVGAGKSSLLRDVVAWVLSGGGSCDPAFGRALRVMMGHAVLDKAIEQVDILRRIVESPAAFFDHKAKKSAPHSLVEVYGRYRPQPGDDDPDTVWTRAKFTVASVGDQPILNKEPSCQAISVGSTFVGERADLIVLDDAVSRKNDAGWLSWLESVEDRLEPGGTIVLLGQRLAVEDGYAQALGRQWDPNEIGEDVPLYTQVSWPAHNEPTCDGSHRQWDLGAGGCLLDEKRIPWRKIRAESDKPSFGASYQQDPTIGGDGLIPRLHIEGGKDAAGEQFVGCLDLDRALGEYPEGVEDLITYTTVDPALSSGYWAILTWASLPDMNGTRWLIDAVRTQMRPDEFLSIGSESGQLRGVMFDIQVASKQRGHPVQVWIVENNLVGSQIESSVSARMFAKSFPDVAVLWPRTAKNKTAPQVGIEATLPKLYREGRVRLPWVGVASRNVIRQFVHELTGYPHVKASDMVMSQWFGETNIREVFVRAERPQGMAPVVRIHGRLVDVNPKQRDPGDRDVYDSRGNSINGLPARQRFRNPGYQETPQIGWIAQGVRP